MAIWILPTNHPMVYMVYEPAAGFVFLQTNTHPCFVCACVLCMLSIFIDFRVPPRAPWSMILLQRFCSSKTRAWIFGKCILWILSMFIDLHGSLQAPRGL